MIDHIALTREVQTVSRPDIHTHLRDGAADRLPIAQITKLNLSDPCGNPRLGPLIAETVKPLLELLGLPDRIHNHNVSVRIRAVNYQLRQQLVLKID